MGINPQMNPSRISSLLTAGILLSLWVGLASHHARAATLLDDRKITLRSASDVTAKRQALIRYIWGEEGFPPANRLPDAVITNAPSPVKPLDDLVRVDELRFQQAPGLEGLAYHFIPARPNHELVVVHHGHACTLDDDASSAEVGYGLRRTIQALLREGYGVLGVFMPHQRPGDCTGDHEKLMQMQTPGSPLKFFLDPVVLGLNYLESRSRAGGTPLYHAFHMVGLSGGGWTTTLCAAVDPRVRLSFPVAGSLPLYLRAGGSIGDREQYEPSFYRMAGYPDLYVLGGHGAQRGQVQILVRRDDCCFGVAQHDEKAAGLPYEPSVRDYGNKVSAAVASTGAGFFRLDIDEVAPSHMISHHAIEKIILPELRKTLAGKAAETPLREPGFDRRDTRAQR